MGTRGTEEDGRADSEEEDCSWQIYESLFKEGVLVAPKDFNKPAHPDMPTVRNLEVIKAMQSLTSKGFVKTQFSWQWYYYTLTDEGLAYLREWLHLPSEIVPQTHMKPARPAGRPAGFGGDRPGGRDGAYRAPRGDREYRRRDDAGEKEGAGGEYRPVSRPLGFLGRDAGLTISASAVLAAVPVLPPRRCCEHREIGSGMTGAWIHRPACCTAWTYGFPVLEPILHDHNIGNRNV